MAAIEAAGHSAGPRRGRRRGANPIAVRRCIASGEVRPMADMIRFVAAPDGAVVPDLAGDLPGRGLWLSPRRDMIRQACARNLFAKAARAPLRAPDDLADRVEALALRRCVDLIGLARRAGQAVCGFESVAAMVGEGKVGLLIQAADGAEGGRRKLRAMARAKAPEIPVLQVFDGRELGGALGRDACVHAAILPGRLAARLDREARRLAALRAGPGDDQGTRA